MPGIATTSTLLQHYCLCGSAHEAPLNLLNLSFNYHRMHKVYPSSSIAEALPVALTAHILQHVPLSQRLTQCSLVSQAWAAAAVLATQHVERTKLSADAIPALESWLEQQGAHLLSLQLSSGTYDAKHKLRLPLHRLAKLQRLQLEALMLRLPDDEDASTEQETGSTHSSSSDAAAPLAQRDLQHLQLKNCQLFSIDSWLRLAGVPQLTFLEVQGLSLVQPRFFSRCVTTEPAAKQQLANALPGLLQQLPRLSVLALPGLPFTAAAAQQTAAMQGLQRIQLGLLSDIPACDLQHLPSTVTHLQLRDETPPYERVSSLPAQLQQLTGLLRLELHRCSVPPTLLSSVTQLQHLRMTLCVLLPNEWHEEFHVEGTAALLDALQQLKQLRHLHLNLPLDTVDTAPQRFSALTASSHLTELMLDPDDYAPLPMGAVQHMFAVGRQLPALQSVNISRSGIYEDPADDMACMDSADITSIIRCCPNLEWLNIAKVLRPGAELSVLLQLPRSCDHCWLGGRPSQMQLRHCWRS